MGINVTLWRTAPKAEDFEQGAHIRALLLQATAQTALTLTALKSEDLEGTAKMKVAAQIRGFCQCYPAPDQGNLHPTSHPTPHKPPKFGSAMLPIGRTDGKLSM